MRVGGARGAESPAGKFVRRHGGLPKEKTTGPGCQSYVTPRIRRRPRRGETIESGPPRGAALSHRPACVLRIGRFHSNGCSVRQTRILPPASFRSPPHDGHPCLQLLVPSTTVHEERSILLEARHARRTKEAGPGGPDPAFGALRRPVSAYSLATGRRRGVIRRATYRVAVVCRATGSGEKASLLDERHLAYGRVVLRV